jgi:uncharacterized membrane protein YcaP (DUF421 family)
LPVTPADMKISTEYKGMSTEIIKDGLVLEQNLQQNNLDRHWLNQELKKRNINNVSDVIYAAVNTSGVLYVSLKKSTLKSIQKVED